MKISTSEQSAKRTIIERLPVNLGTVEKLIELSTDDWARMNEGRVAARIRSECQARLHGRRRKMSKLLEELSLRTSRIQPLMRAMVWRFHVMKRGRNTSHSTGSLQNGH